MITTYSKLIDVTRNEFGFLRAEEPLVNGDHHTMQLPFGIEARWIDIDLHHIVDEENTLIEVNADLYHRGGRIGMFQCYVMFPYYKDYENIELFDLCDQHSSYLCEFSEVISTQRSNFANCAAVETWFTST